MAIKEVTKPTSSYRFSSVQFSRSVMSDSLQPHELQHARPPCHSPTPRVHPNPCPSSWWCHPSISSSIVPFSSCPQSLPTLCMRWPRYWSFSFSIIPSKEHGGLIFRMDWLDLLVVHGTLKSLLQHHSSKASGTYGKMSFVGAGENKLAKQLLHFEWTRKTHNQEGRRDWNINLTRSLTPGAVTHDRREPRILGFSVRSEGFSPLCLAFKTCASEMSPQSI